MRLWTAASKMPKLNPRLCAFEITWQYSIVYALKIRSVSLLKSKRRNFHDLENIAIVHMRPLKRRTMSKNEI